VSDIYGDMAINWRLLLAGLRYEISLGYRSLDPIYRVIAWSFNVAYAGVFPSMDWRGRLFSGSRASFAGKYISGRPYALTEVRGDWKWHKEVFDLRHFWKFLRGTCFKCKATKCPGPFQYVKLQNFENTPRLTTNEFFNMALHPNDDRYHAPVESPIPRLVPAAYNKPRANLHWYSTFASRGLGRATAQGFCRHIDFLHNTTCN